MTIKELLAHPSVQREMNRFKRLGGTIEIVENAIILHHNYIPDFVAEAFAKRIKALDVDCQLVVSVKA